jgi:hypothetical protein
MLAKASKAAPIAARTSSSKCCGSAAAGRPAHSRQSQQLADGVVRIRLGMLPKKAIRVETQTAEDLWPVLGDSAQLHQALMNLCLNAREAMPSGGTLTLPRATLRRTHISPDAQRRRRGAVVLLEIKTPALASHPELRDRIFEPFFTTKELVGQTAWACPPRFPSSKATAASSSEKPDRQRLDVSAFICPPIPTPPPKNKPGRCQPAAIPK